MPDCNECSTSSVCRQECGSYAAAPHLGGITDPGTCNTGPSSFYIFHTVNPRSAPHEAYDELKGAYKEYYLNSWFDLVPDHFVDDLCVDLLPTYTVFSSVDSVEYVIRHGPEFDRTQFKFDNAKPDDDDEGTNWMVNTALDIVAGVSGNPLVGIGAAALQDYIDAPLWGTAVDLDEDEDYGGENRQQWWWDVDAATNEGEFPDSPCNTTGVKFDIVPGTNTLSNARLQTWTRYNLNMGAHTGNCGCEPGNGWVRYLYTTDWVGNAVTFDISG